MTYLPKKYKTIGNTTDFQYLNNLRIDGKFFHNDCKGQLISKVLFGVFKSSKKNEIFVRISAQASKKRLLDLKTPKRSFEIN